ncbi:hypothetical protein PR003_g21311 [Phytophthora rubi]|uniref:Uncharacterized protein n=2 Tax=Phytophthora TaxID=4783 RepID=A0A6A4DF60_9STRA|nr:hypothetical protein PR001_g21530 [Phytophthora rubi]KAE8992586.1 hypothetical protein PR002_g20498 [Phytophthora rubi]KAE9259062.1 hypothetical protein PF008_g33460 [Phytophthora fragariae]KAE9306155.1 hypothetical protein PR003_g21311 [Phytophthora rubi]
MRVLALASKQSFVASADASGSWQQRASSRRHRIAPKL